MRMTDKEFAEMMMQRGKRVEKSDPKPSKYHSIMEECDNIKFQSKKEAKVYRELCCRIHAGEIKFFLMQVPFRLAAGYTHRLDFMLIKTDGSIEYLEVKGRDLPMGKMKRKMVEAEYKIVITVV
jgi:hypothetical protein